MAYYDDIPEAEPVDDSLMDFGTPSAIPLDRDGKSIIPELETRPPTHNESVILSGEPISMASTNVQEFWWTWGHGEDYDPKLFVRFLDGSLYVYWGPTLTVAANFVETDSPGRFVWNVLRAGGYRYERLIKGDWRSRKKPQVVRLV